ncbi:hypothetical protein PHYBOEH_009598 [Phytophthora boehmeriae]|uniref:D-xylose 1-dehydrogenase (NADP(+), D-xylono-1,5-lactone-forming) n=1 Tax=Phytophthora boehmeriae TaxID=109152 RepID=A0A8T1X418_9STRA|nr:hypothetical protein PHYBOEH_009598 [Phytophthora boehmeriae]
MADTLQAPLRWGFLGCGNIANDFVNAMKGMPAESTTLTACAARSLDSAKNFANTHGFTRAYESYEELCADPEVDVVYIATIHLVHFEHISLALNHGKHVLVEKPMTMNAEQTASVIALAESKNLFLLEGVWTRFFPSIKFVRQLLFDGRIGDVHHIHGYFGGAYLNAETQSNFRSSSGDGGLIGIGIYPLSFVTMVFGIRPHKITATGKLSEGGADLYGSATLEFDGNRFGTIEYTCLAELGNSVTITGSKGRIYLPSPAHTAVEVIVTEFLEDGTKQEKATQFPWPTPSPNTATTFKYPGSEALLYEAEAVTKAIRSGQRQCAEYPLEESLAIAKIMDEESTEQFALVISPFVAEVTKMGLNAQTPLRWGFLGCGKIANDFVNALKGMPNDSINLSACAARSLESAENFANTHGIKQAYGSYEELCADPEVDVVYIATIHLVHFEHISLALNHGKHVLVEKPMTMNAKQTASVIALAESKNLFLLEGVWTRFFPSIKFVRELLTDGRIGDVRHIHADIGMGNVSRETVAKLSSSVGDGALLSSGIYPLAFVTMALGSNPKKITASGKLSEGGADMYGSAILEFDGNRVGTVDFTWLADLGNSVTITGSKGSIYLPSPAHCAEEVIVTEFLEDGTKHVKTTTFPLPEPAPGIPTPFNYPGSQGFLYEAEAVTKAIQSGQQCCEEYSLKDSLAMAKIMDEIRKSIGVVYAADT